MATTPGWLSTVMAGHPENSNTITTCDNTTCDNTICDNTICDNTICDNTICDNTIFDKASSHDNNHKVATKQSDLYFRLSQMYQSEIWQHIRTRAELYRELSKREQLESLVQQQTHTLAQWEKACETVYESLNEHRVQNYKLEEELKQAKEEIVHLNQMRSSGSGIATVTLQELEMQRYTHNDEGKGNEMEQWLEENLP